MDAGQEMGSRSSSVFEVELGLKAMQDVMSSMALWTKTLDSQWSALRKLDSQWSALRMLRAGQDFSNVLTIARDLQSSGILQAVLAAQRGLGIVSVASNRPPEPAIIVKREPSLYKLLDELDELPEDQRFDFIHDALESLSPAAQKRFLREAAIKYVNALQNVETTESGILKVEYHEHHHYYYPPQQPLQFAQPSRPPSPERKTPEGDELLTEREREETHFAENTVQRHEDNPPPSYREKELPIPEGKTKYSPEDWDKIFRATRGPGRRPDYADIAQRTGKSANYIKRRYNEWANEGN